MMPRFNHSMEGGTRMARSRWGARAGLVLLLAGLLTPAAAATEPPPPVKAAAKVQLDTLPRLAPQDLADSGDLSCAIYPLGILGDDPDLGRWVAETIPQVIQPGTWHQGGTAAPANGRHVLTYYAPAKILVVYHTAAVQTQVDTFLKRLAAAVQADSNRKSERNRSAKATADQAVVPAQYAPVLVKPTEPAALPKTGYPVPTPAQAPKHLFHFIIRYEGEGIVDSTVASLLRDIYGNKGNAEETSVNARYRCSSYSAPLGTNAAQAMGEALSVLGLPPGPGSLVTLPGIAGVAARPNPPTAPVPPVP
jgi:hypothetical protein